MNESKDEKDISNQVENSEKKELSDIEKKKQYIEKVNEIMKEERIRIVLNQTNYSREEAIEKLENTKYDALKVIKEYMGISEKKEVNNTSKSLHQKRYDVIRECMDNAANNFRKQQEQAKIYNELMEKRKKEIEERQLKKQEEQQNENN